MDPAVPAPFAEVTTKASGASARTRPRGTILRSMSGDSSLFAQFPASPLSVLAMTGCRKRHLAVARTRWLQPFDDGDVGLAAALAHGLQAVAAAGALELVEQGRHQTHAGGAQGMAEGDGAAVDIDLGQVGARLPLPGQHARGEGRVDLDQVDVVGRQ